MQIYEAIENENWVEQMRSTIKFRIASVISGCGFLVLVKLIGKVDIPLVPILSVALFDIVVNYPYTFIIKKVRSAKTLSLLYAFINVSLITWVIHLLGGVEIIFLGALYFFIILSYEKVAFWGATFSALGYSGLIGLEYYGILPHYAVWGLEVEPLYQLIAVISYILLFYLTMLLSNNISRLMIAKNRELAEIRGELELWNKELAKRVEERTEQLEAALAQLIQTEKMAALGRLGGGVAHEINNPLSAILGFTQILLGKIDQNYPKYEDLKRIEFSAKRCKEIAEGLLQYARHPKAQAKPLFINEIIKETLSAAQREKITDRIPVRQNLAPELPPVSGNEEQLKQVFMNLLTNARDAIGEKGHGEIFVETRENEGSVEITFRDTGCGIPAENLDKIFDPFFTTKEVGKGAGLGLSLCHSIILSMAGSITVQSGEGSGTAVRILLSANSNALGTR